MKIAHRGVLLCAMTALSTAACSGGSTEPQDEAEHEQQILAELDVRGVRVQFTEMLPGNVVVVAKSKTRSDNPLADPAVKGLNLEQMYEYWAGKPAPQVLVDAPLRAAADGADQPELSGIEAGEERAANVARSLARVAHTAEAFEAEYCGGSNNKDCALEVIDVNTYFQATVKWFDGMVNSIEGRQQLRLRQNRPVRGWETIGLYDVNPGDHLEYWGQPGGIYPRVVKVQIEKADLEGVGEGDFDVYHASFNGGR